MTIEEKFKDLDMLRGIKYNVPSRGIVGKNKIWRIYLDIEKGPEETLYVEHIEFKGVSGFTGENLHRIGYAFFSKGAITIKIDKQGIKTAIIHPGDYNE